MIESNTFKNRVISSKKPEKANGRYKRLISMGRISMGILNEVCGPIDAANRFINLTLRTIGEDSQQREFLLESKKGIKRSSLLLKKLNDYARRIEREIDEISSDDQQDKYTDNK